MLDVPGREADTGGDHGQEREADRHDQEYERESHRRRVGALPGLVALASWMEEVRRRSGSEGGGGRLPCHALGHSDRLLICQQTLLLGLAS